MTGKTSSGNAAEPGQRLEGAWMIKVFPTGKDASPIVEVAAFIPGGSLVNVAPDGTAGAGEWERIGDRLFAITFVVPFIRDAQAFSRKIRSNLTLNDAGDALSGPFYTDVLDPDGNVVSSYSGTVQATRMRVEPLE